jgi:lipopolysaccharide transport system permease protein
MLFALWRYRYFILTSIKGEFKGRFVRSRLGLLWTILHPLAQATIFAVVLSEVIGARLGGVDNPSAYAIYLLAGIAAWTLFTEILTRCISIFIEYGSAIKKISFPRLCLPIIVWGSALVNHALLLAAIAFVFMFMGHAPGVTWLFLPLGFVLISAFAFGLGLMLGVLNVFSRDIGQITTVVLQLWFWLTPIIYTRDIIPERLLWVVDINPLVPLVGIYQTALLFNQPPDFSTLVIPTMICVLLIILSFALFRRAGSELVDAL